MPSLRWSILEGGSIPSFREVILVWEELVFERQKILETQPVALLKP